MSKDTFENRKIPENKERLARHRCFIYHLNTLLLEMNERRKDPADWTEDKLVPRFKELMNGFLTALKAGILKSFFIAKFNLFRGKLLSI